MKKILLSILSVVAIAQPATAESPLPHKLMSFPNRAYFELWSKDDLREVARQSEWCQQRSNTPDQYITRCLKGTDRTVVFTEFGNEKPVLMCIIGDYQTGSVPTGRLGYWVDDKCNSPAKRSLKYD